MEDDLYLALSTFTSIANSAEQYDQVILEPLNNLLQEPNQSFGLKLLKAFNFWLHVPEDKMFKIEEIFLLMHNARFLINNIEGSTPSRGAPEESKVYELSSIISGANFAMFMGLQKILDLAKIGQDGSDNGKAAEAVKIFNEQMLELHIGQGMELYWKDNFICPSEEEYKKMAVRKTGNLLKLAVRLMQLFSPVPPLATKDGSIDKQQDFSSLTSLLSLYLHLRDDYASLCLNEHAGNNAGFAEEITQGRFSLPIIHAIRETKVGHEVTRNLRLKTSDMDVKKYFVSLLKTTGSLEYTRSVLRDLDSNIRKEIEKLGGNQALISVLDELKDWETK